MRGFIVFDDCGHRYPKFSSQMSAWVNEDKIKFCGDVVDGLENAPSAFIGLLAGKKLRRANRSRGRGRDTVGTHPCSA